MKKNWWRLPVGVLILTLMLITLAACGGDEPVEEPAPEPTAVPAVEPVEEPADAAAEEPAADDEPVVLRIGTTYIWDTANPAISWYGYGIRYLLYDTLTEWGGMDTFKPGLAESWEVSADGLVWTFKIRQGVTFHDGSPMTAEDVAWSLNWTIENDWETMGFYLYNFDEVTALDDTTVQVTLTEPVGNMISGLLVYVWIMPRSVWEGKSFDEVMEYEAIDGATGTGPYKLSEWKEGEYLILDANEDYWGGKPPFDQIVYREYATEDSLVQALLAGEVDDIGVPPTAVSVLEAEDNVQVAVMPSFTIDEIIINSHENGTQPASLNDPAVRLAMAYGVDKQQVVNVAYLGYADAASVVAPPAMGDFRNSDIVDIPFDPAEGSRILEEAGYIDSDGDGIREDADGNPLEYRFYATDDATAARIVEIVSDGLAQVGISAPPTLMDEDSMIALYPDFDFDLLYWGWGLDADPDFSMLIFTCGEREDYGWNDSGYCDEEFDEMYFEQAVTVDPEARKEILWRMQEKLFNDRPYIMLTYTLELEAGRSDKFKFVEECGDFIWKHCLLQAEVVK